MENSPYYCAVEVARVALPIGAKGFGRPTFCGGISTPKSVSERKTGSEKMLSLSVIVYRFESVASKSGEATESALVVRSSSEPVLRK